MITIQNQVANTYVGTSGGEILLSAPGQWMFPDVTYVTVGTNASVNVSSTVRDGAFILVDVSGGVRITDGPDLVGSSVAGFALAFSTLGVFMGIRWVWRKIMGAGGMSTPLD